jgi:hypothetical protein
VSARDKAKRLIERALHPKTPEEESLASALVACRIIDKYDLLDGGDILGGLAGEVPEDLRESVEAVSTLYKGLTDPAFVSSVKKIASTLMRGRGSRRRRRYED